MCMYICTMYIVPMYIVHSTSTSYIVQGTMYYVQYARDPASGRAGTQDQDSGSGPRVHACAWVRGGACGLSEQVRACACVRALSCVPVHLYRYIVHSMTLYICTEYVM